MRKLRPALMAIAITVILFLAILAPLDPLARVVPHAPLVHPQADMEAAEARFGVVRARLAPGEQLGYAYEFDTWSFEWMRGFFRAQYVLAPHPLHYENMPGLILANFHDDASLHEWLLRNPNHFARVIQYGHGLALVEVHSE